MNLELKNVFLMELFDTPYDYTQRYTKKEIAVYQKIAEDEEMIESIKEWVGSFEHPTDSVNERLLGYMAKMPLRHETFYRGQSSEYFKKEGWSSWSSSKMVSAKWFAGGVLLVSRQGRGISLQTVGEFVDRRIGHDYEYETWFGAQNEWLLLNSSVRINENEIENLRGDPYRDQVRW